MKYSEALALLLAASAGLGSDSFRSVSLSSSRHNINSGIRPNGTLIHNSNKNYNEERQSLQSTMTNNYKDEPADAKEAEARKICPLLSLPEDVHATFEAAMGWFWGPQRDFDSEEGVLETVVGYSGSTSRDTDNPASQNPTYRNIQDYGESIRVTFNTDKLTYEQMIDKFFDTHYPSSYGTQYRSAIFCHTEDQKKLAELACKRQGGKGELVAVEMASDFYRAEEYHQKYIEKQMSGNQRRYY